MNEPESSPQKAQAWHLNAPRADALNRHCRAYCYHRHLAMVVGNDLTTRGRFNLSETERAVANSRTPRKNERSRVGAVVLHHSVFLVVACGVEGMVSIGTCSCPPPGWNGGLRLLCARCPGYKVAPGRGARMTLCSGPGARFWTCARHARSGSAALPFAGCMDAYAYMRQRGMGNLAAFVCIDHPPRGLSAQPGEWAAGDATDNGLARVRSTMDMIASKPTALFETYEKALNARDLTPEETSWFVRQGALTPEYAVLLLRADIWFSDFRDEAKKIDGTVRVLNVISEPNVPKAIPWIKANTPHSETFTIKRHMSFWSEPDSFNSQLEGFLTNIK